MFPKLRLQLERIKGEKHAALRANDHMEAGRLHQRVGELETDDLSKLAGSSPVRVSREYEDRDLDELMRL